MLVSRASLNPISYVVLGMVPYFLMVPWALMATAAFCRYLDRGGLGWWMLSAFLMVGVVLIHLTGAMIAAPAAGYAYACCMFGRDAHCKRLPRWRHFGVWLIPILVLVCNAFWWLPGIWLASTKGPSDFAFGTRSEVPPEAMQKIRLADYLPNDAVLLRG